MTKQIAKSGRRLLSLLLVVMMVLSAVPMSVFAEASDDYIEIRTAEDLYNIRDDMSAKYILMNDIDLSEATAAGGEFDYDGRGWDPIGSGGTYGNTAFTGELDGNGYSIIGMNIAFSYNPSVAGSSVYCGLFAKNAGTIQNLKMKNVNIFVETGLNLVLGAICADNIGTISECVVEGKVEVNDNYVGGIAGRNMSNGIIKKCCNKASVTTNETWGTSRWIGGIAGYSYGSVENCYNTGNITDKNASSSVTSYVGGIVGYVTYKDSLYGTIANCYNVGIVSTATVKSPNRGIAQKNSSSSCTITNSYYLEGSGNGVGTSLTQAQMELQSSYSGFDFDNVWSMEGDSTYLYPELRCFTLTGTLKIKGDCVYLSTVTVDISGIDKIDDSFTYRWFVDFVFVGEGESYTIKAEDVGKKIRVKITGKKEYNEGSFYSALVLIGKATQTAKPVVPELLMIDDSSFEITTTSTQEYSIDNKNWQKSGVFTNLDPNKTYTVYTRILENDLYLLGSSTNVMQITTDKRALQGSVAISGTARYGDTLTADVSNVGPANATYTYEWNRNGVVVGTGKTYTLGKEDIGNNITVSVVGNGNFVGTLTSAAVTVTKATVQLPNAPVVAEKTNTTVTLVSKTGYEYSMDKVTWQSSPVFTGLYAATEYTFYQRVVETETTFASVASSGTKVTTLKNTVSAPSAPVVIDVTNTTVTLKKMDGFQYSKDGLTWQDSNVFTGLNAYTEYAFCQRIAETDYDYASAQSSYTMVITLKNSVAAPSAPIIASATDTSVTLKATNGYQYSIDGVNWQNSNVFKNLETLKTYTFYQRIAETGYDYASPASEATSFKVKHIADKTEKPVLVEATNNKIVVEARPGCQFSIDGTTWTEGNTFTGLSPNTTYYIYCRTLENDTHYAGEDSDVLIATTLKNTVSAPAAPTVSSTTATKVTLTANSAYEYSMDGTTWQTSNVFEGLSPNATYTFYQRVAETDTSYASAKSAALTVTTPKKTTSAPAAPVLSSKTTNSVKLTAKTGCEYSMDGITWQTSNVFEGLSPNTTYTFYQRVAETDTKYASEKSEGLTVTTPKYSAETPAAPVKRDASATTITLQKVAGCEYSKDGTNWQDSNVFTGLTANRTYTFYQRVKETSSTYASDISASAQIKTTAKSDCSIKPADPIVKEVTTNKIVLVEREGYEYKIGSGSWTTNPTFTSLSANTSYTVYQRVAATADEYASSSSTGVTVKTLSTSTGTTAATNYDKLRNYIDYYGKTNARGYKVIELVDNTISSNYKTTYRLTNTSDGIEFFISITGTDSERYEITNAFTLKPSSTDISPYCMMVYYKNNSLRDYASGRYTLVRTDYSSSVTYTFRQNGDTSAIPGDYFSKHFNSTLKELCVEMDAYIYSKLGFGLRGLGFTAFSGYGSKVCDPLSSYHTGGTVTRNAYSATCTTNGYTGDTCCASCGEKITSGTTIACRGYHSYTNSCDKDCNTCGEERRITHTYSSDCDEKCNKCSHTRIAPEDHNFENGKCGACGALDSVPGDVNGDEKINSLDGLMLMRYLNGWNVNIASPESMDVNGDGKVNSLDGLILMRYLNGWNVTLG